jgi:predicted Zn-dependent protease
MVTDGRFREDLFYRLGVITIQVPALRERGDDLRLLAEYFLEFYGRQHKRRLKGFTQAALRALMAHPWPGNVRELENRMQRALAEAQSTGRLGTGMRNRDQFLSQLQGIYVDDDPAQGIIEGRSFTHPDLRIQFSVPPGYLMQNSTHAVTIKGSAGQAQFSGGRYGGSIENYIIQVFQQLTGGRQQLDIPPPQRTTINGFPAAFTTARANTSSGVVDVSVVAYQWNPNTIYHFVMVTTGGAGISPFASMVDSLRRISPAEAAAIRPRVIDIVTVRPGDTVQSLASRMAYRDFQVDRFLTINGLAAGSRLAPGQKVKLVVYGARRS